MNKLFYLLSLGSLMTLLIVSCGKENADDINEEISKIKMQEKKIQEIIPKIYLDSLRNLGLEVNAGVAPPVIQGNFKFSPVVLRATSVPQDAYRPGFVFTDSYVKLFDQKDDFSISLIGKNFLGYADTSVVTAVSGSENNFTVYGKVKAKIDGEQAEFAMVMSGLLQDGIVHDQVLGIICIKKENQAEGGKSRFIPLGTGRLVYESDKVAEPITNFDGVSKLPNTFRIDNFMGLSPHALLERNNRDGELQE